MIKKIIGSVFILTGIGLIGFGIYGLFLREFRAGTAIIFAGIFAISAGEGILKSDRFEEIARDIVHMLR